MNCFSGIILCELIGRLDADPDTLPRTENFGVDYIAFSAMCPNCPPEFLKLTFSCVRVSVAAVFNVLNIRAYMMDYFDSFQIDPSSRPSAKDMVYDLDNLLESQRRQEARNLNHFFDGKITLRKGTVVECGYVCCFFKSFPLHSWSSSFPDHGRGVDIRAEEAPESQLPEREGEVPLSHAPLGPLRRQGDVAEGPALPAEGRPTPKSVCYPPQIKRGQEDRGRRGQGPLQLLL
jgi:hypothetical protein